jgi:hypothetical protein
MMEKGKELECSRRAGGGKGEPGGSPYLKSKYFLIFSMLVLLTFLDLPFVS